MTKLHILLAAAAIVTLGSLPAYGQADVFVLDGSCSGVGLPTFTPGFRECKLYYNRTSSIYYYWSGTAWVRFGQSSGGGSGGPVSYNDLTDVPPGLGTPQTLQISGSQLSISDGNTVTLPTSGGGSLTRQQVADKALGISSGNVVAVDLDTVIDAGLRDYIVRPVEEGTLNGPPGHDFGYVKVVGVLTTGTVTQEWYPYNSTAGEYPRYYRMRLGFSTGDPWTAWYKYSTGDSDDNQQISIAGRTVTLQRGGDITLPVDNIGTDDQDATEVPYGNTTVDAQLNLLLTLINDLQPAGWPYFSTNQAAFDALGADQPFRWADGSIEGQYGQPALTYDPADID